MHYSYAMLPPTSKTALIAELALQECLTDAATLRCVIETLNPATTTPLVCPPPLQPYVAGMARKLVVEMYKREVQQNRLVLSLCSN